MKKLFLGAFASFFAIGMAGNLTFATAEAEKKADTLYGLVQLVLESQPEKLESNTRLVIAMFTSCANAHKNAVIQEACGIVLPKLTENETMETSENVADEEENAEKETSGSSETATGSVATGTNATGTS